MSEQADTCSQASAWRSSLCKSASVHAGTDACTGQSAASHFPVQGPGSAQRTHPQAAGRAAFWGECGCPVLPGGRPLRGHRALPTCLPRRHVAGGGAALFIYLLRHNQVRGAAARARFLGCRRQPQPAYTSSESVELHAAKTRLVTGAPGQQAAQNRAQTVGKEQTLPQRGWGRADCSICPSGPGVGHHLVACLGVEGQASSAVATLRGARRGPWMCSSVARAGTPPLRYGVFPICSAPCYGTL